MRVHPGTSVLVVLLAGALLRPALAADRLSLEAALAEALTQHPLLAVASARVVSLEGKRQQAGLRPNPLLVYQTEDFRAWSNPGHRFWQDADHFFYLQQTFETAAKRARRTELALAQQRRGEIELLQQKQSIAARVRAAYWDAAGARARQQMLEQSLRELALIVTYHRDQVREGAMAEADLLRVELEQQRLSLLARQAEADGERQSIRLQREMGRAEIGAIELANPLEEIAKVADPAEFAQVWERRAEAQLARQLVVLAGAQMALETALAQPNFDGVAGYKRSRNFDTVIWGVQAPLPLFNRNQGNIASAGAEQRLAQSAESATQALLRAEFRAAEQELSVRRQQLETFARPLQERAQSLADLAQQAYRLGGADLLRLLDAQRNLLDARQVYLDSLLALRQAEAAREAVLGVLP